MDFNFLNKNIPQNKGKKQKNGAGFGGSIVGALFIFMLITALYLVVSDTRKAIPEIPISVLANNVSAGEVKKILVEGDKLTVTYVNDEVKMTKKKLTLLFHKHFLIMASVVKYLGRQK